jgi:undecaprenyl-diphosphatase
MEHIKKQRKIIVAAIAIVIFILVARRVLTEEITFYDKVAHDLVINNLRCEPLTIIMKFFTFLCSVECLLTICVLTFLFGKDKKESSLISINLIINFLLNTGVKYIFQRPRPSITEFLINEHGYSFPSGHSMVAMAFYGYIVYMIYKHEKPSTKKYLKIVGLLFVIFMIGLSRIYLGVHYASDVLAGFMLSISYLMLFIIFSPKILDLLNIRSKKNEKKTKKTN